MRVIAMLWLLLVLPGAAAAVEVEPDYIPAMIVSEANFRADPSTKNPPLGTYQAGTQLLLLGHTNDDTGRQWYLARLYDSGLEGYISAKLVRPLPSFPAPPESMGVTKIGEGAEAEVAALVGLHALLLKSIGSDPGGEAVVFQDLGLLYLEGSQTNAAGDRLGFRGTVTDVGPKFFRVVGRMEYQIAGVTCSTSGDYRFELMPDGKGWRYIQKGCGSFGEQIIDIRKRAG